MYLPAAGRGAILAGGVGGVGGGGGGGGFGQTWVGKLNNRANPLLPQEKKSEEISEGIG